jgi:hypothetical protein
MPGDPEGSRVLASRCAEFAATATTPQLKAWFPDLSMRWRKLAIELALRNRIEIVEARGNLTRMVW